MIRRGLGRREFVDAAREGLSVEMQEKKETSPAVSTIYGEEIVSLYKQYIDTYGSLVNGDVGAEPPLEDDGDAYYRYEDACDTMERAKVEIEDEIGKKISHITALRVGGNPLYDAFVRKSISALSSEQLTELVHKRLAVRQPSGSRASVPRERDEVYLADSLFDSTGDDVDFSPQMDETDIEIFLALLEQYIKTTREEIDVDKEAGEQQLLRKEFLQAVEEHGLPIPKDVAHERIHAAEVFYTDPLVMEEKGYQEGFHIHEVSSRIHISRGLPSKKRKEVYFHEALHSISGRTKMRRVTTARELQQHGQGYFSGEEGDVVSDSESSIPSTFSETVKGGLRISPSSMNRFLRFEWLDEAVTERITMQLLNEVISDSYEGERELLEVLIGMGLDEHVIHDAYFENYTKADDERGHAAWRGLFKQTNKMFGDGFLMKLDAYVHDMEMKYSYEDAWDIIHHEIETNSDFVRFIHERPQPWRKNIDGVQS